MNRYREFITGCSTGIPGSREIGDSACNNTYDVMTDQGSGQGYAGAGASSTGNIYGIYDISGGAWEYAMGVFKKMSGNTKDQNSGYAGLLTDNTAVSGREWPDAKYYDNYASDKPLTACNGNPCKGHALNETAGWYGDYSVMLFVQSPWSVRGGCMYDYEYAGVFYFHRNTGGLEEKNSFRQVLTPM